MSNVKLYKEASDIVFRPRRIKDDRQYAEALEALIVVATDCLLINQRNRTVYLTRRRAKPMSNHWWFVGGRMLPGELEHVAMSRRFKRETKLDINPEQFRFLHIGRYFMKNREQEPQDTPSDNLTFVFCLDVTEEEVAKISANLDSAEYFAENGLREFTREQLVTEGVFTSVLDAYDVAFHRS